MPSKITDFSIVFDFRFAICPRSYRPPGQKLEHGIQPGWGPASPEGRQAVTSFDEDGRVIEVLPGGLVPVSFSYDSYGRPLTVTLGSGPDARVVTYTYYPDGTPSAGMVESVTDPHGVTTPTYDPVTGNVTSVTGPGGETLSYVYDGSLLTDVTWSGTIDGTVSRGFDNNFRTISRTVNGAGTVLFGYDDDGLLTSAGDLVVVRDAVTGFIDTTTLGVVTTDRTYSDFGELESEVSQVSGVDVLSRTYGRDDLGRIISITETVDGTTTLSEFEYDLVGHLFKVYEDGSLAREYTYDDNGNRLSVTEGPVSMSVSSAMSEPAWQMSGDSGMAIQPADDSGGLLSSSSVTAIYDDQDRLLEMNGNTYEYTPNGELLSRTVGSVDTTYYTYDVYGNLVTVELPDGTVIDYVIDPGNRRIGRVVDGFLEQGFLYRDGLNPVAELDGAGAVVSRFVYGTRGNVPEYMVRGGFTYRIVADHLGSVRMVVDVSSGTVVQELEYDEWGNVLIDTNPGFQPFGFAGGIYDADTGLVRFGARDYDPEVGRWTSKDPIGFAGRLSNLYEYVNNDPINWVDPSGLQVLVCAKPAVTPPFVWFGLTHYWLKVPDPQNPYGYAEAGYGPGDSVFFFAEITDHSHFSSFEGALCYEISENIDEVCVFDAISAEGFPLGVTPLATCVTFVNDVLRECSTGNRVWHLPEPFGGEPEYVFPPYDAFFTWSATMSGECLRYDMCW